MMPAPAPTTMADQGWIWLQPAHADTMPAVNKCNNANKRLVYYYMFLQFNSMVLLVFNSILLPGIWCNPKSS